jgi:hypothetical protein
VVEIQGTAQRLGVAAARGVRRADDRLDEGALDALA